MYFGTRLIIGHTSTSGDRGVAFERFFGNRLVHLVQFLKNVFWSGLSIAHAFLVYS